MMKYQFDKSSKKFVCPSCNKRRFVRFVSIENNEYLDNNYGKCDRETNCGYIKRPNSEIATLCMSIKNNHLPINNTPIIHYHSEIDLQNSLRNYYDNNFYLYLISIFIKEDVQELFKNYRIGTSKNWNGATVFWQIDNQQKIRAGKILLLDHQTCKRVKNPYPHITWVHSKLKIANFELMQCLFGLHLIDGKRKIAIVESEKTAIIMALMLPEYTWLATGNKQNFKIGMLEPIKRNQIIAFPDKSEFDDWNEKAAVFNKSGYKITVSRYIEDIECENGTDLADLYIANEDQRLNEPLSKDEITIKKFSICNNEIFNLIETFGLCDTFDNPINVERIKSYICDK